MTDELMQRITMNYVLGVQQHVAYEYSPCAT